ncbi:YitT family protein [Clostridium sp. SYSU_GA19001]|uniref:YitT family protein n=1 Tax=Clostridium caldaquaticum TaxID=2940653 RepID=UPI0020779159|nr:YitT family protein [Clostridium caldaquaticum]MCM8710733.1 YitT family protein [Clostridium caldaquaticum]
MRSKRKSSFVTPLIEYSLLIIGSLITAVSFNVFLVPNNIASGGVTGTSLVIEKIFGIQPAFTQWALNIPLFIVGIILFGNKFGLKTAVGSVLLPLFILMTKNIGPIADDLMLNAVFGGLAVGIGLGLTLKSKGSTGGFSILAYIIHDYTGITIGNCMMIFDSIVITAAGFAFGAEKALYALISLFITSKAIDFVQMGFGFSKVAFVISENNEAIQTAILNDLDRGVTKLSSYGGYTGKEKGMLMVVVGQNEVTKLKNMIKSYDPNAFIIMCDTYEVLGKGFKFI